MGVEEIIDQVEDFTDNLKFIGGIMTDIEKILLDVIKSPLKELSEKRIGIYDGENTDGIHYILDGKAYLISVTEEM